MPNWAKSAHGGAMPIALLSMCLLLVLVIGCGGQSSPVKSSPTPQLAPSVAATSLPDPATSSALHPLIISVWLRNSVTLGQRSQLAEQIAQMPEVQEFAFVSKKLALLQLEKLLKLSKSNAATMVSGLKGHNPVPAYFEIVVKTRSDVLPVARRFFSNPLVDNDPGTHDGVAFGHYPKIP
jgi:hypothetical protein